MKTQERNCNYRNCNCSIEHKDPRAFYCGRNCKGCERKYRQRDRERLERYTEYNEKVLNDVKINEELGKNITSQFKLIYEP